MFMLCGRQGNYFQTVYALYAIHAFIALAGLCLMPASFAALKCVRNNVTSQDLHLYMIEVIHNNDKGIAGQKP